LTLAVLEAPGANVINKILIIGAGRMAKLLDRFLGNENFEVLRISSTELNVIERSIEISQANLILEYSSELFDKKKIILGLVSELNDNGIIATGTSSLNIDELKIFIQNPTRFLGVHFMNPPHSILSVECIATEQTSINVKTEIDLWLKSISRQPIWVPNSPGFVLNAVLFSMCNRAAYLVDDLNIPADDVDRLLEMTCGHPIGPLRTLDLIGLDVAKEILQNLFIADSKMNLPPAPSIISRVEIGELGRKSKRGFYSY
jgi:3-hydroxybutyryl-CoA dehydrogenase